LPNSAGPFRTGEFVKAGLLVLTGFVVCAGAIHAALPNPFRLYASLRSEQLEVMDRLRGSSFSSAFGSSHVHNGFDPAAFDRVMAGTPAQSHTENMAIPGGSQVEQRATALEYLKDLHAPRASENGPKSCTVLLELGAGANIGTMFMVHPRTINLYDWRGLKLVSEMTDTQMGRRRDFGRVGFAAIGAAMYYMNVGMVSNLIFKPDVDEKTVKSLLENDRRGAELMPSDPRNRAHLEAEFAAVPKTPQAVPTNFLPGNYALVDELRAAAPVHPLSFVYLEMPLLADLTSYAVYPDQLQSSGGLVPVIDLARPDRYPELYQPKYWHDDAHLNDVGAELATTIAANELKSWYATHGWPSACKE